MAACNHLDIAKLNYPLQKKFPCQRHFLNDEFIGIMMLEPNCDQIVVKYLDWLQSFKQFFINVSYQIFVASLTLMALF